MLGRMIVGGGVIAGVLGALWFSTVVAAMGKAPGSIYPNYEEQHRQAKDRETHRWTRSLKNYPPAEAYQPNCSKDDKGYECFLLWRSARAAEVQARAAIDQAYWARWSFWFLVATFVATAFAARYAYKAAAATHRGAIADEASAVAANATLHQMQDTAQRQLRAYISVRSSIGQQQPDGTINFVVQITNAGQTPAYELDAWIGVKLLDYPIKDFKPEPPQRKEISKSVLGPGLDQELRITRRDRMTVALSQDLIARKKVICVVGRVDYMDIFGRTKFTDIRLLYFGQSGTGLKNDAEGNQAS
jgi:hypothetical protein